MFCGFISNSTQRSGGIQTLSRRDFPANLPEQYRKCYEELHELLNLISFTLREVKDKVWRRRLAEMCVLVLGVQEMSDVNKGLNRQETESYIG